jgi:hypothetical protein
MSALDTIKSAILGVPTNPQLKPSRQGTVNGFEELQILVDALNANIGGYSGAIANLQAALDAEIVLRASGDVNLQSQITSIEDQIAALQAAQIGSVKGYMTVAAMTADTTSAEGQLAEVAENLLRYRWNDTSNLWEVFGPAIALIVGLLNTGYVADGDVARQLALQSDESGNAAVYYDPLTGPAKITGDRYPQLGMVGIWPGYGQSVMATTNLATTPALSVYPRMPNRLLMFLNAGMKSVEDGFASALNLKAICHAYETTNESRATGLFSQLFDYEDKRGIATRPRLFYNAARSGAGLSQIAKNTAPWNNLLDMAQAAVDALGYGQCFIEGMPFDQGESNNADSKATYKAALQAFYDTINDPFASGYGTFSGVGTNGDTITIGSRTYTLKTVLAVANDVLIGASATATASNLAAAINAGAGSGSVYHAGTTIHPDVTASPSGATVSLTAKVAGNTGAQIATTKNSTSFAFGRVKLGSLRSITGQSQIIPLYITQTPIRRDTGDGQGVTQAQLELHIETMNSSANRRIFITCVRDHSYYGDALHPNPYGQLLHGAEMGQSIAETIYETNLTNYPTTATRSGNTIILTCSRGIVIEPSYYRAAASNYGFVVKNAADVVQTINSISIDGSFRIVLTMAATPAAGWKVQYAYALDATASAFGPGGFGNMRGFATSLLALDGETVLIRALTAGETIVV